MLYADKVGKMRLLCIFIDDENELEETIIICFSLLEPSFIKGISFK